MDTKGGKGDRINWEIGIDVYILLLLNIKLITREKHHPVVDVTGDRSKLTSHKRGEVSKYQETLSLASLWGVLESQRAT